MGAQHAVGRGPHDLESLEVTLLALVDRVTRRMRSVGRTGSTITLRLRFDDFTASTAARTMARPTAHTGEILDVARGLLRARWPEIERRGCTLVGVSIGSLDDQPEQLALPLDPSSEHALDDTIDAVRDKFGAGAVRRAAQLTHREREAQPILPD